MWAGCVVWSTAAALLIVRQADLPDVATASFVVTITGLRGVRALGGLRRARHEARR